MSALAIPTIIITIDAKSSTTVDDPHPGEEFGYVLSGSIVLRLGTQTQKLRRGDAFYFKADKQHNLKNRGKTTATVLWVSSPPNF